MTRGLRVLVVAASLAVASPVAALPRGEDGQAVVSALRALNELRIEDAEQTLAPVLDAHPQDPDVLRLRALIALHLGAYDEAVTRLEQSLRAAGPRGEDDDREALKSLITATRDATAGFEEARSKNGRYHVRYAPGRDVVLVPYALEALRRADEAISEDLGVHVPGPIRLEIYPTPADLASVSTLSVEDIQRTGTIALCKWDRLMVTSPRALVRGYPWMDTIGHELVHLLLARASRDHAPVWLQEGIAKFLERRWRGEAPKAQLEPAAEALLMRALRRDELIPFERLHPSIALLPSQEDAALAFAQVSTFIEAFHAAHGADGLRSVVRRIAQEEDARSALAAVAGRRFADLERAWRDTLRARPSPEESPPLMEMRFRAGTGEVDESAEVEVDVARRFVRLGDLLWGRDRPRAAAVEYGHAHDAAPDDPIVASRLGRAALAGGQPDRALRALEPIVGLYPDHAPAHALMSSARLAKGDLSGSRAAAREAIRLNPFDPQPHCDLAGASRDEAEQRRESTQCQRLGGTPEPVRD